MVSWLCALGVNPNREGTQEMARGGGYPLKVHLLSHRKPFPQQGAVPGFELGVLPALVIAPGPLLPPPRVTRGQMEAGIAPPSPGCAGEAAARPVPGNPHFHGPCLCGNVPPEQLGHPQYLVPRVGRASPLSAAPRGPPGRVGVGHWTWLQAALQGQKPLGDTSLWWHRHMERHGAWGQR